MTENNSDDDVSQKTTSTYGMTEDPESLQEVLRMQPHEHEAQLLFASEAGLSPFFAVARQFSEALENQDSFRAAGEEWVLDHEENNVKKWTGKIAARPEDSFEAFNEYNLGLRAVDETGDRTINFQFRPALPEATHVETGERIESLPADLPEGVRVQVRSVNVEPVETLEVLRGLASFLGIRSDYFERENLHSWSRLTDLAVYVRLERAVSENRVVCANGLLENMATLASRNAGRGQYKWDNEEIMGHYTAVAANPTGLESLELDHRAGKRFKSYHMANPESEASENATSHPKIEVQHSPDHSAVTDNRSVPWEPDHADAGELDRRGLRRELEEALANALSWADLPLSPTVPAASDVYVEDVYWSLEERTEADVDLPEVAPSPLEDLQEEERDLATAHLLEADASDSEKEVLRALTDGGFHHYEELADEADTSVSTVYRAMDTFGDLLRKVNGEIELANDVVREKVASLFRSVDRVMDRAASKLDRVVDEREADMDLEDTALGKWARRYAAEFREKYGDLEVVLHLGELSRREARRILIEGFRAADATGTNTRVEFGDASVRWTNEEGYQLERESIRTRMGRGPGALRVLGAEVPLD